MVDRSTNTGGNLARRITVIVALLIILAAVPTASAAKPAPAATCGLYPGESSVTWRSYPKTTSVELQWFDANGALISAITIVPTKAMRGAYSQQTPSGAAEFGVSFSDGGGVFAVTGLVCT